METAKEWDPFDDQISNAEAAVDARMGDGAKRLAEAATAVQEVCKRVKV